MKMIRIGSLEIPKLAALEIEQSYEPLEKTALLRAIDGTGIKQATWQKTRITTSGVGWMPSSLGAVDTNEKQLLKCITSLSVPVDFATRQAALPAKRRSDAGHTPWGLAILASGRAQRTTLALAGDIATLGEVDGAVDYRALYYPQFTVWVSRPTESGSPDSASHRWELVCEEV